MAEFLQLSVQPKHPLITQRHPANSPWQYIIKIPGWSLIIAMQQKWQKNHPQWSFLDRPSGQSRRSWGHFFKLWLLPRPRMRCILPNFISENGAPWCWIVFCICVFVYLDICAFVYLYICIFPYLCICIFVYLYSCVLHEMHARQFHLGASWRLRRPSPPNFSPKLKLNACRILEDGNRFHSRLPCYVFYICPLT